MTFDPTKPCTTRDGREVRLFTERMTDGRLVGIVVNKHGVESIYTWMPDGSAWRGGSYRESDLINIPEKRTVWVNFHKNGQCFYHCDRLAADFDAQLKKLPRYACVKVEFEEGEGL